MLLTVFIIALLVGFGLYVGHAFGELAVLLMDMLFASIYTWITSKLNKTSKV